MGSPELAAFFTSSGISAPGLYIFFASILMSIVLIFVIVIMRGNHRSWSKEKIDFGDYSARTLGLILIVIIAVYLVN